MEQFRKFKSDTCAGRAVIDFPPNPDAVAGAAKSSFLAREGRHLLYERIGDLASGHVLSQAEIWP